ncbi:MAG TPA: DUF4041 domain-containing protein [Bacteroidetes bacterium]|nr:DUF4041 domain-containing protein [Bacteroidota bacterium]
MNYILISIILALILALVYLLYRLSNIKQTSVKNESELQKRCEQYKEEFSKLTDHIKEIEDKNQRLSKWEKVADADDKARKILETAETLFTKMKSEAKQSIDNSRQQASTMITEAKQQSKIINDEAQERLNTSTIKASQIIDEANKKAEEIAGSAYIAMNKADLYEKTVQAMKNIIEGYGDNYLIPGYSLLDNLAQDFEHTEAGKELKLARERTKAMIRTGTAATCDYVEKYRRDTAIKFVIDAFNGKVDSILSRVRNDNIGKLKQEINDAFILVNFNGNAFRNARITNEYLTSRLDELKWAAITQQLRIAEREEQRFIKERIREEEKARKEFERAIRDAEKEEEIIRKAIEKARLQIDKSSEEQKLKYEKQLEELTLKLKEAEDRGQRALSMAQQTKRGYVYIISNIGSFGEHVYKIGLTRRLEPLDRIRELGDSSVPFIFDVHAMIFSEDAPALEYQLHKHFVMMQMNKVNYRKEFFKVDLHHIRKEIEKLGITPKWTMTAEACEYHETMAIEKSLAIDSSYREEWAQRQIRIYPISNDAVYEALET